MSDGALAFEGRQLLLTVFELEGEITSTHFLRSVMGGTGKVMVGI